MYNEQIKQKYLSYLDKDHVKKQSSLHIFKYLADYEYSNNEDLYNIPYDSALQELLRVSRISSFSTFRVHYYTIKNYKTWALLNGFVSEHAKSFVDEAVDLKELFLNNYHLKLYKTPAALADHLHKKLNKRSDNDKVITIDQIGTAYVMLIYQGVHPDKIFDIKLKDVIITNNNIAIITDNKAIIVYHDFENDIKEVSTIRNYIREYANIKEMIDLGDRLIDNGTNNNIAQMRGNFASLLSSRHVQIKMKDVYYMGRLYDFYQNHGVDAKKQKILEWCFNGDTLTKTRREQFYRFIELWNM